MERGGGAGRSGACRGDGGAGPSVGGEGVADRSRRATGGSSARGYEWRKIDPRRSTYPRLPSKYKGLDWVSQKDDRSYRFVYPRTAGPRREPPGLQGAEFYRTYEFEVYVFDTIEEIVSERFEGFPGHRRLAEADTQRGKDALRHQARGVAGTGSGDGVPSLLERAAPGLRRRLRGALREVALEDFGRMVEVRPPPW